MQQNLNNTNDTNLHDKTEILCKTRAYEDWGDFINSQKGTHGKFQFFHDPTNEVYSQINLADETNKSPLCTCKYNEISEGVFKINDYDCKSKTMQEKCIRVQGISLVANLNNYSFNNGKELNQYIINSGERNCNKMCSYWGYALPLSSYTLKTTVFADNRKYNYSGNECNELINNSEIASNNNVDYMAAIYAGLITFISLSFLFFIYELCYSIKRIITIYKNNRNRDHAHLNIPDILGNDDIIHADFVLYAVQNGHVLHDDDLINNDINNNNNREFIPLQIR